MGKIEQNIAKQAIRSGQPLPDRIANAPELRLGLQLYLDAFFDLDSDRSHGFGPSPIPWSSIKNYCEFYEFDFEQTEEAFFFIRRIDNAHLQRLDKNSKKDKNG